MLARLLDFFLYHVVRPVGARTPFWLLDVAVRVLAVPVGVLLFATSRPSATTTYLRAVGHRSDALGRLVFCVRKAHRRMMDDTFYLRPFEAPRMTPAFEALLSRGTQAVFMSWSWFGVLSAGRLARLRDDRMVRYIYGGEGGQNPKDVPLGMRWNAHTAWIREKVFWPTQIVPGEGPRQYISAMEEGKSIFIIQDVPDATGRSPMRTLLGTQHSFSVGGVRLAKAGGLPIYTFSTSYRRGEMVFDVQGPLDVDEQGVLDHLGQGIQREPWAWDFWWLLAPESDFEVERVPLNVLKPI